MPVGDESQVGEGLLRGSDLALGAREEVGKVDEEAAVALPLVRRQRQDAGDVEVLRVISSFSGKSMTDSNPTRSLYEIISSII